MGCDKALLRLPDGRSALEAVVGAANAITDSIFLAVESEAHGTALLDTLGAPPRLLVDSRPGSGPLAALGKAFAGVGDSRGVLLLAVDMPLMSPAILLALCGAAGWGDDEETRRVAAGDRAVPTRADLVVPVIAGVTQPMPGLYAGELAHTVWRLLVAGRRSLRSLIEAEGIAVRLFEEAAVRSVDPRLLSFAGANTPEEWAALCARAARLSVGT